jgi:hypothetical protein
MLMDKCRTRYIRTRARRCRGGGLAKVFRERASTRMRSLRAFPLIHPEKGRARLSHRGHPGLLRAHTPHQGYADIAIVVERRMQLA